MLLHLDLVLEMLLLQQKHQVLEMRINLMECIIRTYLRDSIVVLVHLELQQDGLGLLKHLLVII